jgi:hypothetical protein
MRGMTKSFVAKIIKESALVYDIRTKDKQGNAVFFIIEIEKSKHNAFREKMAGDFTINLLEYGKILHQGYGEPDDTLKAQLRDAYGMYEE